MEPSGGQATPPWTGHCLATFDADYQLNDSFFDQVTLSVLSGDACLLGALDLHHVAIHHLSTDGSISFEIEEEGGSLPFSSNCSAGAVENRVGVFVDIPLYGDEALTEELCVLDAGTITTGILSYQTVGNVLGDRVVYETSFPTLPELCPGVDVAFMEARPVAILGIDHGAMPIGQFLTPCSERPACRREDSARRA